jgi:hypothetical protein
MARPKIFPCPSALVARRVIDVIALLLLMTPVPGRAAEAQAIVAAYRATWAGLPAGEIRLSLRQSDGDYRDEIEIASTGLPHWLTKFRADAVAEGRLPTEGPALPSQYDARYDLRQRRDSRINLRYFEHDDALIAERGAADTSHKPLLAEGFRRNALDPLSALAVIRRELQIDRAADRQFIVPVFDGARRFDVAVKIVASGSKDRLIRLRLTLHPIAGFHGESSEDGDPDSAARPVDVTLSDDAALLVVSLRVSIAYLPLEVRLDHLCDSFETCSNGAR